MTNEEIIEQIEKGEPWEYMNTATVTHIDNLPAALDLARQDEREKIESERIRRITTNHLSQEYGLPYEVQS